MLERNSFLARQEITDEKLFTQQLFKMKTMIKRMSKVKWLLAAAWLLTYLPARSQQTLYLPLQDAVRMGIENSKQLGISKAKIAEAISQYKQAQDARLPTAKITFMGSEAFIPTTKFAFGQDTLHLPSTATLYMGILSIEEPIFAGNKFRYAKQSAELLQKIASSDTASNRNEIAFGIINTYYDLLKVKENQKIVAQNVNDIQQQLDETRKFEQQGLATENDVLRWQLQLSNAELTGIELENNRKIINYNMTIMLGLSDSITLVPDSTIDTGVQLSSADDYISQALSNRKDLEAYGYQLQLSDVNINKLKDSRLPTLGLGVSGYYVNPNTNFFPPANSFVAPVTVGLNLGWNISSLYTTKNKVSEANIQKQETELARQDLQDNIKKETNASYHDYLLALDKIKVLQTAVDQATENDRIMESKYKNQLANTTDRIDAETMLYQAKVNLQLAKVDARVAYYNLLKSTGTLQ